MQQSIAGTIPARPPYMPRPNSPDEVPPQQGELWPIKSIDAPHRDLARRTTTNITYSQYWNRFDCSPIGCREVYERGVKTTIGSKIQLVKEISGKLRVGTEHVSAELSSRLGTTVTISEEINTERKITAKGRDCYRTTFTTWQLVDRIEVTQQTTVLGVVTLPRQSTRLDQRAEVYWSEAAYWAQPDCCPDRMAEGPGYTLDFRGVRILLVPERGHSRETIDVQDRVKLVDVTGEYHPGDLVPAVALGGTLADLLSGYDLETSAVLRQHLAPFESRQPQAPAELSQLQRVTGPAVVRDAAPLGLGALALVLFATGATLAGLSPGLVWLTAAMFGGLAQFIAGMWEFKSGNTFGATAFSTYGAFWLSVASFVVLVPVGKVPAQDVADGLGWFGLAVAIFNTYMMLWSARINVAVFLVFLTLEITEILVFIGFFSGGQEIIQVAGYSAFIAAFAAWYGAAAGVVNAMSGQPVLPLGSRLRRARDNDAEPAPARIW